MKKTLLFLSTVAILNMTSCVSYQHLMDAEGLTAPNKSLNLNLYEFKGTYSIGSKSDLPGNDEKLQNPTYRNILLKVRKVFGENATFCNVVWDIKKTNVLGLKVENYNSVIFDVYVPKK